MNFSSQRAHGTCVKLLKVKIRTEPIVGARLYYFVMQMNEETIPLIGLG